MVSEVDIQQFEQSLLELGYHQYHNIFSNDDKLIATGIDIFGNHYVIFEYDYDYTTEIALLPENVAYVYHSNIFSLQNIDGYNFIISKQCVSSDNFLILANENITFRVQYPGHCTFYADTTTTGNIKSFFNLTNGECSAIAYENAMNCIKKLIEIYVSDAIE